MYATDLLTGLLCCLAIRGITSVSRRDNRLDRALSTLMPRVFDAAEAHSLCVLFRIRPHFIHGDSSVVHGAVLAAGQQGLVTFEGEEIHIRLVTSDAEQLLGRLPGGPDLYKGLTRHFVRFYETA